MRRSALQSQLGKLQAQQAKATTEVATGRDVTRFSDAPMRAGDAKRLDATLARQESFRRAGERLETELQLADGALSSATDALTRASELASQIGSGSRPDAAFDGALVEVQELREALVSAANTKLGERYIFAGVNDRSAAFAADGTYQGSNTARTQRVQSDTDVPSWTGDDAFGAGASSVFAALDALEAAIVSRDSTAVLAAGDRVSEANSTVVRAREESGYRINTITEARRFGEVLAEQAQQGRSDAVDSDIADSISRLERARVGLEYTVGVARSLDGLALLRRLG
ncbi:MAG: flagellar hook-associated protein 3 FlgL [Bradymonadia bacterium]|jgi:flagellar hook-associated protein 3 FlgL